MAPNASSTQGGPSSLPLELVNNAHREVRRLQELRRIIQEECDHLLLRKERLKEEVGCGEGAEGGRLWLDYPGHCHHSSGSMSLDASFQYGEGEDTSRVDNPPALGAVARAFKVLVNFTTLYCIYDYVYRCQYIHIHILNERAGSKNQTAKSFFEIYPIMNLYWITPF